jgi:hypothetical protein
MKKISTLLLTIANMFVVVTAQNSPESGAILDDATRVVLNTYVSDDTNVVPDYAQSFLKDKLNQITTEYGMGMGGSDINGRFFLTAKPVFINKEVVSSTPIMYAYNVDVILYIVDAVDKVVFETVTINSKGSGNTENKAFTQVVRSLNTNDSKIKSFIEKGKQKIVAYYNSNCETLLQTAQSLANRNEYGEAYYILGSIPSVSNDCYSKSLALSEKIFPKYIEFDCNSKLNQAQAIWNANISRESADKAGALLSQINPNAKCFTEAKKLGEEIKARLKQLDDREWDLFFKKEYDLEKSSIQATRDIGVAWGNGQPNNVTTTQVFRGWPW